MMSEWNLPLAAGCALIAGSFAYLWNREKKPDPSGKPAQYKLEGNLSDLLDDAFLPQILATWNRPLAELPVHIDLPRLGPKFRFYQDGQLIAHMCTPLPEEERIHHIIRSIYCTLSTHLGDPVTVDLINQKFYQTYTPSSAADVAIRSLLFLQETFDTTRSPLVHVLKCCNQSAIAPLFIALKGYLGSQLPYKDFRGGWHVEIHISAETVTVVHVRREQSFSSDPSEHWEFEWTATLIYDRTLMTLTGTKIRITEIVFLDSAPDVRSQVEKIFQPILDLPNK